MFVATIALGRRKASMGWILFILFIALPIAEIAVLLQAGSLLGVWPTVGLVILTAAAGGFLAKMEGRAAMQRLTAAMQSGDAPIMPVLDAAAIFTGGLLLLTPGFITDFLGLSLLFGPTRMLWGKMIATLARRRRERQHQHGRQHGGQYGPGGMGDDGVIDGVYREIDPTAASEAPPKDGAQPSAPQGRPGPSARYEDPE